MLRTTCSPASAVCLIQRHVSEWFSLSRRSRSCLLYLQVGQTRETGSLGSSIWTGTKKIRNFLKKSVAGGAKIVDMARSLCEKLPPLSSSLFAVWHFGRVQSRR